MRLLVKINLLILSVFLMTNVLSVSGLAQMSQEGLDRWLLDASKSGDIESVKATLKRGADVNTTDENGCTPLMYALNVNSCGSDIDTVHFGIVQRLVSAGALNQIDAGVLSEFLTVVPNSAYGIPDWQRVGERHSRTNYIERAVSSAIRQMSQEKLGQLLLDTTLLPIIRDSDVWSVEAMIEAGADINVTDENGCTPFSNAIGFYACTDDSDHYHHAIVDKLFEAGLDLNQRPSRFHTMASLKDTFLIRASAFGNIEHVTLALEANASVNGVLSFNRGLKPPLFRASENCRENIVRVLVIAGASIDHIVPLKGTALDIARENCSEDSGTIRVLQDAGGITSIRPVAP